MPASFRPDRSVTFSYTATSTSGLDLALSWSVRLTTCVDSNADGSCTSGTDANYHDFGTKALNVAAGASGTVSWSVNLHEATGPHAYNMVPTCASPCTGQAPTAANTKRGAFQLAYTNTWTRTLTAPSFAANGSSQSVTYRLASTSPDDADLTGTAVLYSTPNSAAERLETAQPISAAANTQQTLSWNVLFAPTGGQQERVTDSTTSSPSFANATVLDVQLNVTTPRSTYTSGAAFGYYVTLLGYGNGTTPQPLQASVQLVLRNGSFALANVTIQTDANGTAYQGFQASEDLALLNWTANASFAWNSVTFTPATSGTVLFESALAANATSVDEIRGTLANLSFKGVHLDELGTHNLLLEAGRVTVYALAAALVIALIVIASFRV